MARCTKCQASVSDSARLCPQCGHILNVGGDTASPHDAAQRQLRNMNLLSFALAIPGIAMQIIGRVILPGDMPTEGEFALSWGLQIGGTILVISGLGVYAMMKGRSFAWALLGFFNIIGLLVLAVLAKICPCGKVNGANAKACASCSSPI